MPGPTVVSWQKTQVIATGLRNSMGLVVMPSGAVLAAVNDRDAINLAFLPYHGYRAAGHHIMTLAVDATFRPTGMPVPLVWGWEGKSGLVPTGSPVAVAEMTDGTLLFSEDHNGTLLRLAREE